MFSFFEMMFKPDTALFSYEVIRESGENVHGLGVLPRGEVEFRFGVWDTVLVALHVTPSVLGRNRLGKVK